MAMNGPGSGDCDIFDRRLPPYPNRRGMWPRVTIIDGCAVHGDRPMTAETYQAMQRVISAVRAKLSEPIEPKS